MGGVCFSDMGGGSFLSGGYPMGAINFGGGGGFEKNQKIGGGPPTPPPAMGNPGLTVLLFLDFFLSSALIMIVLELPY